VLDRGTQGGIKALISSYRYQLIVPDAAVEDLDFLSDCLARYPKFAGWIFQAGHFEFVDQVVVPRRHVNPIMGWSGAFFHVVEKFATLEVVLDPNDASISSRQPDRSMATYPVSGSSVGCCAVKWRMR
jgi:hypothetical protein